MTAHSASKDGSESTVPPPLLESSPAVRCATPSGARLRKSSASGSRAATRGLTAAHVAPLLNRREGNCTSVKAASKPEDPALAPARGSGGLEPVAPPRLARLGRGVPPAANADSARDGTLSLSTASSRSDDEAAAGSGAGSSENGSKSAAMKCSMIPGGARLCSCASAASRARRASSADAPGAMRTAPMPDTETPAGRTEGPSDSGAVAAGGAGGAAATAAWATDPARVAGGGRTNVDSRLRRLEPPPLLVMDLDAGSGEPSFSAAAAAGAAV